MNGVDLSRFASYPEDVFNFLRRKPYPHAYDFIILDPPAFAKRSADLEPAKKAYTDLNRLALQALPSGDCFSRARVPTKWTRKCSRRWSSMPRGRRSGR